MKKVIYISNVNLEGGLLSGVINKINGQIKAFKEENILLDILYPDSEGRIVLKRHNGETLYFKGGRKVAIGEGLFKKTYNYLAESYFGSIDFSDSQKTIFDQGYDVIYLRFFMPGTRLITFLSNVKINCPDILVLLEYPTLSIKKLFSNTLSRRVTFILNDGRIKKLNRFADYIISLTDEKTLFGRPVIFMPNGFDVNGIEPVPIPPSPQNSIFVLLGVASDVIYSHGYDKIITGLRKYYDKGGDQKILFRLISNPRSKALDDLKILTKELALDKFVSFEMPLSRTELIDVYKSVHFGVGTLAQHRIGLKENYSLKHREYAAFGIPFIMNYGDAHFNDSPFVLLEQGNDNPVDIKRLLEFYYQLRERESTYPKSFMESIKERISWRNQMKDVFSVIKNNEIK